MASPGFAGGSGAPEVLLAQTQQTDEALIGSLKTMVRKGKAERERLRGGLENLVSAVEEYVQKLQDAGVLSDPDEVYTKPDVFERLTRVVTKLADARDALIETRPD